MSAPTRSLTSLLAERYDDLLTGRWTGWSVVRGALSETSNARLIGIVTYPLLTDPLNGQDLYGMQLRVRGQRGDGMNAVQDVQAACEELIALHPQHVEDVVIAWRNTSTPLAQDAQGRPEVFDTYWVRTDRLGRTG